MTATIDQAAVARRVNALLRKAESSTHEPERIAFTEKAQQLIARFQIDAAILQANAPEDGPAPIIHRRWAIEGTYANRRINIAFGVSRALGLKGIQISAYKPTSNGKALFFEVFGTAADVEWCETLYGSLSAQLDAGLKDAKSAAARYGEHGRTFATAFVQSYALRVSQRFALLVEAERQAAAREQSGQGPSVALVLADKGRQIDAEYRKAHPRVRSISQAATSSIAGRIAGVNAGNSASFARGAAGSGARRKALV